MKSVGSDGGRHRVKLWPGSLAGQLIALLLIALVGSQLLAGLLFFGERRDALLAMQRDHVLARTASVVRLLATTAPDRADEVLAASSSRLLRFRLSREPAPEASGDEGRIGGRIEGRIERRLAADLAGYLEGTGAGMPRVALTRLEGQGRHARLGLTLAVPLGPEPEALWLAARTVAPLRPVGWAWPAVAALAASATAISLIVIFMVRRVTRPLRRLAEAAEAFGRGEPGAPLEVQGPVEARRSVTAFNEMRGRIRRFVDDRMSLLAAISHDLRTPITALRLRAELIEETETREKMLETLAELQRMVEATLSFAREESTAEPTRRVDVAALIEALVADFAELGAAGKLPRAREPDCGAAARRPAPRAPQPHRQCLDLWRESRDGTGAKPSGSGDPHRRRGPRHSLGAARAGVRSLSAAGELAQPRDRWRRPGSLHHPLHCARARRRSHAPDGARRRLAGGTEPA